MSPIPPELKAEILADPFYTLCARKGLFEHVCDGRITWEHAIIFAGRQLQKKFAIIPICEKGHDVGRYQDRGDLVKEIHLWIALSRATIEDLRVISKAVDYLHRLRFLQSKYGKYVPPKLPPAAVPPLEK